MARKLTLKQVDEEVWYDLYDGNGASFNDRFDFVTNGIKTLKGMTKFSKILETIDTEKVGEMSATKGEKFLKDKSNYTYDIGNYTSTKGVLNKTSKGYIHEAQLDAYASIPHSVAMELTTNDDTSMIKMELQKMLTEELFLKKRSPHFLGSMGSTNIRQFKTILEDASASVPKNVGMAMVYEKYTDKLEKYMDENEDFEDSFFYYNVFMQALIALAQFHKTTGMHLNGVTYDNFYYLYSGGFEGLGDNDVEKYVWNEYQSGDKTFYTPALNIVVILHNYENFQSISEGEKGLNEYLTDYEALINLFTKKRPNKFLKQFMDKVKLALSKAFSEGKIKKIVNTPNYVVETFGKFSGKKQVKNAVFYSTENYGSDVLNDINYLI
jgi:hypothetical protein